MVVVVVVGGDDEKVTRLSLAPLDPALSLREESMGTTRVVVAPVTGSTFEMDVDDIRIDLKI